MCEWMPQRGRSEIKMCGNCRRRMPVQLGSGIWKKVLLKHSRYQYWYEYSDRNGHFCLPKKEELRSQLYHNAQLNNRDTLMNSFEAIVICMISALGISIVYMILVQFWPEIMNKVALIIGIVLMTSIFLCICFYPTDYTKSKIAIIFFYLLLLVTTVGTLWKNRNNIEIHGIFLQYSTRMLTSRLYVFLYIPLFMVILTLFILIVIFEFKAFWTSG